MAADVHSQYVHPQHPPDKEYRDDGPRDVNYPVAGCFRFSEIEHTAMVAGPAQVTVDENRRLSHVIGALEMPFRPFGNEGEISSNPPIRRGL
jgi:hypothetical protein